MKVNRLGVSLELARAFVYAVDRQPLGIFFRHVMRSQRERQLLGLRDVLERAVADPFHLPHRRPLRSRRSWPDLSR